MLGIRSRASARSGAARAVSLFGPDGKAMKVDGLGYDHFSAP
jgi:hypothetical protein